MINKHKKNLNEKYHVFQEEEEDEGRRHKSPVVLKLRAEGQSALPMTPPELRKDIVVDDVEKYQDQVKFEQYRDERRSQARAKTSKSATR